MYDYLRAFWDADHEQGLTTAQIFQIYADAHPQNWDGDGGGLTENNDPQQRLEQAIVRRRDCDDRQRGQTRTQVGKINLPACRRRFSMAPSLGGLVRGALPRLRGPITPRLPLRS